MRALLVAMLFALPLTAADPPREPRLVALVVGVSKYDHNFEVLNFAERDAEKLAEALKARGFDVALLTGSASGANRATKKNIDGRLKKLLEGNGDENKKARKGDVVLVFLSGHGQHLLVNGGDQPFFCAADSLPNLPETQVGVSEMIAETVAPYGATNLLLVDACREVYDPNKGKGLSGEGIKFQGETAVLFSCRRGEKSYEIKTFEHGLFTHAILKALAKGGDVTWGRLADDVQGLMASDELRKHLPPGAAQTPVVASGEVRRVLLSVGRFLATPFTADAPLEADYKLYQESAAKNATQQFLESTGPKRFTSWRDAAEKGNAKAMVLIAACLVKGTGVVKNRTQAFSWYQKAANAGLPEAMSFVGLCYGGGLGVTKNEVEAVKWYHKAANAGDSGAMLILGDSYENGIGVAKDRDEAIGWYRKAAEKGDISAKINLNRLGAR